jgi:hypothetical protein
MAAPPPAYRCLADLAAAPPATAAFRRVFRLAPLDTRAVVPPPLAAQYGVAPDGAQRVVGVQNRVTLDVAYFNPQRGAKPQTFSSASVGADGVAAVAAFDPTRGGGAAACDFCALEARTAADTFGRVAVGGAVSASNLFKYCAPAQGLIILRRHDPLALAAPDVADALAAADGWFREAARAARAEGAVPPGDALHPLLVWNCLPRAGASQFHAHAQVMLSQLPFPAVEREARAAAAAYPGGGECYYSDLRAAHAAAGLARWWGDGSDGYDGAGGAPAPRSAAAFPSLCPWRDGELVVHGAALGCPAFAAALHAALRALLDGLGAQAFNVGIYGMRVPGAAGDGSGDSESVDASGAARGPVVARVASRGRAADAASDFGGLEVFAGAAPGKTDPWAVAAALDAARAAAAGG